MKSDQPFRIIAQLSGTSATALFRHKRDHITSALVQAKRVADEVKAETLFDRLRHINRKTAAILEEARQSNSPGLALSPRVQKQIELEARLLGELSDSVKVAIGIAVKGEEPSPVVRTLATVFQPVELMAIQERFRQFEAAESRVQGAATKHAV